MSTPSATLTAPAKHHRPAGAPWSFQDAAVFLSISERHLIRLCDDEIIKSFRLGRRRFIADAEMQRVANEGV